MQFDRGIICCCTPEVLTADVALLTPSGVGVVGVGAVGVGLAVELLLLPLHTLAHGGLANQHAGLIQFVRPG